MPQGIPIDLPTQEIIHLYVNKGLSIGELARYYRCSPTPIRKRLCDSGIKRRRASDYKGAMHSSRRKVRETVLGL